MTFRKSVAGFARDNNIPVVRFGKTDRKIEMMRPYLDAQAATGRSGVAAMPLPLTEANRVAGYWWEVSMHQVEVSRTLVFAQPRHARGFFEALVADNL